MAWLFEGFTTVGDFPPSETWYESHKFGPSGPPTADICPTQTASGDQWMPKDTVNGWKILKGVMLMLMFAL